MENLYAMVARVGDGNCLGSIRGGGRRRHELAGAGAARAEHKVKDGAGATAELLYAMVASLGYNEVSSVRPVKRRGAVKLPAACAVRADGAANRVDPSDIAKCSVKQIMDAIVARVGDEEIIKAKITGEDGHGAFKLPVAAALRSVCDGMGAVAIKSLDAVVARVGDDKITINWSQDDRRRKPELPVAVALRAERKGKGAVEVENLYAVVARVGDEYPTFPLN